MNANTITPESFTRVNNDVNNNPRYVIHFLDLISMYDANIIDANVRKNSSYTVEESYKIALKKAKTIGGRKYNTKAFGGGILFQSYNLPTLAKECNDLLNIKN